MLDKTELENLLIACKSGKFWSFRDFAYALRKLGLIVIPTHGGKTAGRLQDYLDNLKHAEILRNEAVLIVQAVQPLRIVEIINPALFAKRFNVPENVLRDMATMIKAHYRGTQLIEVQALYLFLWDDTLTLHDTQSVSLPVEKSKTKEGFKLISMAYIPSTRINLNMPAEYLIYQVNSGRIYTRDDLKCMPGKWITFWKSAEKRVGRPPEKWPLLRKDLARVEVQTFLENKRVKKILFVLYEYHKPILLSKLINLANIKYDPARHILRKLLKLRLVQRVFKGHYKLTEAGYEYVRRIYPGLKWEMPVKLLKKFKYLPKDFKKSEILEGLNG